MHLDIRENIKAIQRKYGLLPEELARAIPRSINRTMPAVRKAGSDELRRDYAGIKVKALQARMKMQLANARTLRAEITVDGQRFNLYGNFGMQAFGQFGVRFKRLPWRIETISGDPVPPAMLARAFRNRLRRGGRPTVFSRHTKHRLSFEILVVPGLAKAYQARRLDVKLTRVARERFPEVFLREARFLLSKRSTSAWLGV